MSEAAYKTCQVWSIADLQTSNAIAGYNHQRWDMRHKIEVGDSDIWKFFNEYRLSV